MYWIGMLTITTMFMDTVVVDTTRKACSLFPTSDQVWFARLIAVQHEPYNAVLLRTFRVGLLVK